MDDDEFAARMAALDEHHLRFLDELEKTNQRLAESRRQCTAEVAESRRQFNERLAESRRQCAADLAESRQQFNRKLTESKQQFDHEFAERDARWAESDRRFWERLDLYDQRDVAFVRRMEQLREKVDLLSGQSGQIADDLVEHKRDPDAHG